MGKLREWYLRMLHTASADGIVASFEDIQEHVSHLTSIRDFPLFEGDFFPDHLKTMLTPPPPTRGSGPPLLCRESSSALAASLKNKTKAMRKRFLVATLKPAVEGAAAAARGSAEEEEEEVSNELVDKRMDFLRLASDRHWQFNEVHRAHFSTMMVLSVLGGAPRD